jgi:hypothetical protein
MFRKLHLLPIKDEKGNGHVELNPLKGASFDLQSSNDAMGNCDLRMHLSLPRVLYEESVAWKVLRTS